MCQPGRPLPQGLSHAGSPGLADFHKAKSPAIALLRRRAAPFALLLVRPAVAQLAVAGVLGTSKNTSPPLA